MGAPPPLTELTHREPKLSARRVEDLYMLLEQYGDDVLRAAISRAVALLSSDARNDGSGRQTLMAEEVAHRRGTRLSRAVRAATSPFLRTVEEFDFSYPSTLRLTTIGSLLAPDFVTEGRSVILEGRPGRGETYLAIAVAYRALQNGFDALFTTAAERGPNILPG